MDLPTYPAGPSLHPSGYVHATHPVWYQTYIRVCIFKPMTCNPSGDVGCNPSGHGDRTLLVGIFHLTILDPHQDHHQEEAHTIFINNIIMSTNDLLLKDIIARSALGFYCLECSRSLQDDSVRTHLQRQHKHVFDSTPPVAYQNHLKELRLSTANASVDACLVGPVLKGAECSNCRAFFKGNISWIFSRHQKASIDCADAHSNMVKYRNTYCFRQHIIQQCQEMVPETPLADRAQLAQPMVTPFLPPPTPRHDQALPLLQWHIKII